MKSENLMSLLLTALLMASCTNEMNEFAKDSFENVSENLPSTRSLSNDTIDLGELVCLEETEELLNLKRRYEENHSVNYRVRFMATTEDDFFSSNVYAIREFPITIKVRSVANGSTPANTYLFCDGAGKEVTLGSSTTVEGSKFYLKVLPASSGIPYLIFSNLSKTPLTVGHYTNKPDNKVLMSAKDNSGSLFSASWDLIPSSYKGYFSIQSESYLGQSDPNNNWSVFHHVLEAVAGNKLGYSQRVNNKAQQEFLINPTATFSLQNITFDLNKATVTNSTAISKVTSLTNKHEYVQNMIIDVAANVEETSSFNETEGTLKLNISSSNTKTFPRPIPIAGKAVLMDDATKDAIYSNSTQKFSSKVEYKISIDMKPRSLLQLTTKFKTFILDVPYIATAKYGDREVKVKGTWKGYAVANPEYYPPVNESHFYDLETGEELNYSLSLDALRNTLIVR